MLLLVRKRLRAWLGIATIQRQIRDLDGKVSGLEGKVAISNEDLERLNAATSRIAARVASLLDQIDALGTGNDDQVRQEQQLADVQEASSQLRPVIEQLEALGADASQPVPEPSPEQVPVEPGPDVPPVENVEPEAPAEPAPAEPAPAEPAPAEPGTPDGTVVPSEDVPAAGGETVPGPSTDAPSEEPPQNG